MGLPAPCRTPYAETFMRAQSTGQGQTARQISASYLLCIVQLCEYVFPIGFPLCAKKWGFGGFEGEDEKDVSNFGVGRGLHSLLQTKHL